MLLQSRFTETEWGARRIRTYIRLPNTNYVIEHKVEQRSYNVRVPYNTCLVLRKSVLCHWIYRLERRKKTLSSKLKTKDSLVLFAMAFMTRNVQFLKSASFQHSPSEERDCVSFKKHSAQERIGLPGQAINCKTINRPTEVREWWRSPAAAASPMGVKVNFKFCSSHIPINYFGELLLMRQQGKWQWSYTFLYAHELYSAAVIRTTFDSD